MFRFYILNKLHDERKTQSSVIKRHSSACIQRLHIAILVKDSCSHARIADNVLIINNKMCVHHMFDIDCKFISIAIADYRIGYRGTKWWSDTNKTSFAHPLRLNRVIYYWQFFVFLTFSIGQRIKWLLLFIVRPIFLCCAISHSHTVRYVVICVIMILIIAVFFLSLTVAQRELPWNILRTYWQLTGHQVRKIKISICAHGSSIFIQNNKLWLWNISHV